jgi:hypothetical protein
LVSHDVVNGVENEFLFTSRVRQFMVTPDDQDVLFWTWCVPGIVDCLYDFHVSTCALTCIYEVDSPETPARDPDLDDPWTVWSRYLGGGNDQSYLLNWRGLGEAVPLDPVWADNPRISYPWVAWKGYNGQGYFPKARNLETGEAVAVELPESMGRFLDVDDGLLVYSVGEYLLTHLYELNLNSPDSEPCRISWDNGAERPIIHNSLVVWNYVDGATGRSAIQGRDLETGLTFDIGVWAETYDYDVRNNIIAWADPTYYPKVEVFLMLTRPYPQRGDLNGDNVVDISDIMLVASHWRDAEGDPGYDKGWDLNWDGRVDVVDTMLVVRHWGETWPPPTPTPTVTPTSTPRPSPIPIGGAIVPVNKLELLTPWICSGLLAFVTVTLLARMGIAHWGKCLNPSSTDCRKPELTTQAGVTKIASSIREAHFPDSGPLLLTARMGEVRVNR